MSATRVAVTLGALANGVDATTTSGAADCTGAGDCTYTNYYVTLAGTATDQGDTVQSYTDTANTVEACATACDAQATCNSFSFSTGSGHCHTKTASVTSSTATTASTEWVTYYPSTPPTCVTTAATQAFDCSSDTNTISATPADITCANPGCSASECCTTLQPTCANINAAASDAAAFDCASDTNDIDATPAGITCSAAGCSATECCTVIPPTCANINAAADPAPCNGVDATTATGTSDCAGAGGCTFTNDYVDLGALATDQGNDVESFTDTANTLAACQTACDNNAACNSFSWNVGSGHCHTKTATITSSTASASDAGGWTTIYQN
eukprot:COSAG06_NODE_10994_length_1584_cov_1.664646_1_plen_326_part_10